MTAAESKPIPATTPATKPAAKTLAKPVPKPVKAAVKSAVKKSVPKTAKPVTKAVSKTPAKTAVAKPVIAKPAKPAKVKKPKMVRDSFTMPKPEFAILDILKLRAAKLATPIKKTELIRAGIKSLAAMPDAAFLAAIKAVPNLKTGRPSKS